MAYRAKIVAARVETDTELTIFSNRVYGTTAFDRLVTAVNGGVPVRYLRTGGDVAVLASLLRGLRRIGVAFDANPCKRDIAPVVVVQSDLDALRRALDLKSQGVIRRLIAGPNLVVLPHQHDCLIADPRIDACLVPSEWVRVLYETDEPSLSGRVRVWAAGVDERHWRPASSTGRAPSRAVLYRKVDDDAFVREVKSVLEETGREVEIVEYGAYNATRYRQLLSRSELAVFLSSRESQGLALAEAWSMNVPTLVWDAGATIAVDGTHCPVSSAPYLTSWTGAAWKTTAELARLLERPQAETYNPREWLIKNMTDEVSARALVQIARE